MKRSILRSALVVSVALLTAVAAAAPAHAAVGTWSPPVTVSSAGNNSFAPQLVVLADGTIVATWYGNNGAHYAIESARSTDAGASWSSPVTVSAAGVTAFSPSIALAGDGRITVAWAGDAVAQVATSTDAGLSWSAPLDLSAAGPTANNPQVVVAADGTIAVSWELYEAFTRVVQATTSTNGGATWGAPSTLSPIGDDADNSALGVAFDGTLFATWVINGGTGRIVQVSRSIDAGATWSAPYDLSAAGSSAYNPRLAASPDGTITATWQRYGTPHSIVQTSRSADGGATWSAPFDLSADGVGSYDARVAVAPDGMIAVIWVRGDGSERIVQASTSSNGGASWSMPADLSIAGFYSDGPAMAVAPDGTFTVVWKRVIGPSSIVEVATLTAAGATWSAPLQLSPAGFFYDFDLAVAGTGAVTVAWHRDDGLGNNSIETRTLQVPAVAGAALAATGIDVAPMGLAGAVLLALGAALVHRRRGSASS